MATITRKAPQYGRRYENERLREAVEGEVKRLKAQTVGLVDVKRCFVSVDFLLSALRKRS